MFYSLLLGILLIPAVHTASASTEIVKFVDQDFNYREAQKQVRKLAREFIEVLKAGEPVVTPQPIPVEVEGGRNPYRDSPVLRVRVDAGPTSDQEQRFVLLADKMLETYQGFASQFSGAPGWAPPPWLEPLGDEVTQYERYRRYWEPRIKADAKLRAALKISSVAHLFIGGLLYYWKYAAWIQYASCGSCHSIGSPIPEGSFFWAVAGYFIFKNMEKVWKKKLPLAAQKFYLQHGARYKLNQWNKLNEAFWSEFKVAGFALPETLADKEAWLEGRVVQLSERFREPVRLPPVPELLMPELPSELDSDCETIVRGKRATPND